MRVPVLLTDFPVSEAYRVAWRLGVVLLLPVGGVLLPAARTSAQPAEPAAVIAVEAAAVPEGGAPPEEDNPQVVPLMQQHQAHLEPLLEAELNLAILVGRLAQPERATLRAEAKTALAQHAKQLAEGALQGRRAGNAGERVRGEIVIGMAGPARQVIQVDGAGVAVARAIGTRAGDPQSVLGEMVARILEQHVSTDVAERYVAEREAKRAAMKQTIIANILTGLDEKLLLTADQRRQLSELIDRHWDAPDPQLLDQFTFANQQNWLPVPDSLVQSILTPTQRRVWSDRRNHHTVVFNAFGGLGVAPLVPADEVWRAFDVAGEASREGLRTSGAGRQDAPPAPAAARGSPEDGK
jgi:hypothetical protein